MRGCLIQEFLTDLNVFLEMSQVSGFFTHLPQNSKTCELAHKKIKQEHGFSNVGMILASIKTGNMPGSTNIQARDLD